MIEFKLPVYQKCHSEWASTEMRSQLSVGKVLQKELKSISRTENKIENSTLLVKLGA